MFLKIKKDDTIYLGVYINRSKNKYILKEIFSNKTVKIDLNDANNFSEQSIDFNDNGVFEKVYNFLLNDNTYFNLEEKIKIVTESDDIYENFLKQYNLKILSCSDVTDISILQNKILDKIEEYKVNFLDELSEINSQEELFDEIEILKNDLENNVNNFKISYLPQITFENFTKFWPTLLNPSPYKLYLA